MPPMFARSKKNKAKQGVINLFLIRLSNYIQYSKDIFPNYCQKLYIIKLGSLIGRLNQRKMECMQFEGKNVEHRSCESNLSFASAIVKEGSGSRQRKDRGMQPRKSSCDLARSQSLTLQFSYVVTCGGNFFSYIVTSQLTMNYKFIVKGV